MSAANAQSTLTMSPSMQVGFFQNGDSIGPVNPHAYRPNEFVVHDMIFEGLVAWDADSPGPDGTMGTNDDFIVPSLAASWTDTAAAHLADSNVPYEITFTLQSGVTFHDGEAWTAAAAVANFDHIMAIPGFHDWYGLPFAIASWTAVDTTTFKVTFNYYYEAALRELCLIRPFRFTSPLVLPNGANGDISCGAWRNGAPRAWSISGTWPSRGVGGVCRGTSSPIGTGPYVISHKLMSDGTSILAANFNATCWAPSSTGFRGDNKCVYATGVYEKEIHFDKFVGHRANPSFDKIIIKAYAGLADIRAALIDGTLDMAYGLNTISPSGLIALATQENSPIAAHEASHILNTRHIVLNSAGRLNTTAVRRMVMGLLLPYKTDLIAGELAEETTIDQLFDKSLTYCNIPLRDLPTLAADTTATPASITQPLRFVYQKDIPHQTIIASSVIAALYSAGIAVEPMPMAKSDYNDAMNAWIGNCDAINPCGTNSFDIAYSETWGPPYDPSSKLFDMTYEWGSGEADAVATTNMETMSKAVFKSNVRALSQTTDATARQALYTTVLTTLHEEAVFVPLTAKHQIAVTNTSTVSGFEFGCCEFDIPVAKLFPTPAATTKSDDDGISGGAMAAIVVASAIAVLTLICLCVMISKEKAGTPMFTNLEGVKATKAGVTMTTSNVA